MGITVRASTGSGTRIVATGCTSGIGFQALRQLVLAPRSSSSTTTSSSSSSYLPPPPYHILLLARKGQEDGPSPHALRACQELEALLAAVDCVAGEQAEHVRTYVELREMDLASLRSVRGGAQSLLRDVQGGSSPRTPSPSHHRGDGDGDAHTSSPLPSRSSQRAFAHIAPGRIDVLLLNAAVAKGRRVLVQGERQGSYQDDDDGGEEELSAPAPAPAPPPPQWDSHFKGGQRPREKLRDSHDRYEETACVNHVSQQLLVALLSPALLPASHSQGISTPESPTVSRGDLDRPWLPSSRRTPRIVFTGSALHRRLKSVEDLDDYFDPRSSSPWSLTASYGASKFLQMLGVQRLIRQLQSMLSPAATATATATATSTSTSTSDPPGVDVVCVQPGFVPSTNLGRESGLLARLGTRWILPLLSPCLPFVASEEQGGEMILRACFVPFQSVGMDQGAEVAAPQAAGRSSQPQETSRAWQLVAPRASSGGVSSALLVRSRGASTPVLGQDHDPAAGGHLAQSYDLRRQRPDVRTEDAELQEMWWPDVVRGEWQRQTEKRSLQTGTTAGV